MDEPLRLEYSCTPAETKEARNLQFRYRVGGGSKWRTHCILLAALALMLFALYQKVKEQGPLVLAIVVITTAVIFAVQRSRRKEASKSPTLVEITPHEIR